MTGLPRRAAFGCAVAAAFSLGACRSHPAVVHRVVDARRPLIALVESEAVAAPGTPATSCFGPGWKESAVGGTRFWVPAARAELDIVNLGEEIPRVLAFDIDPVPSPAARLWVRLGPRLLGRVPLTPPVSILLPADLPIGRVPLELDFEGGEEPRALVRSARIEPVRPAGAARIEADDIVQRANSLVTVDLRLRGNETLVGSFAPPGGSHNGDRWELAVERADGSPIRRFEWASSFWNRWRGVRRLDLPLRGVKGPARLSLLSVATHAAAPAARWQHLELVVERDRELPPGL